MAEEALRVFHCANAELKKQNYLEAEELYTKFISSCIESRYYLCFEVKLVDS